MKKSLKIIIMVCCLFFLTGCVKYNAIMDIRKDKSMDFSIIYAVDTSIFGEEEIYGEEEKKEIEEQGFTIENYNKNGMKGYTIKINVPNIDEVSSTDSIVYNLTKATKGGKKENKIFKLKKGIFKNTYKANLKFDSTDSDKNTTTTEDNSTDFNTNYTIDDSTNYGDFDTLANSASNLDLSFKVNIPYSAISNNATQTSNDNKELVWSLSSDEASDIEFEFSLYNRKNIIITSLVITLIIIVVVIFIINNKKKNSSETDINSESNIEKLDINARTENNNNIQNTQTTNIEKQSINNDIDKDLLQEQKGPSLTDMYARVDSINNAQSNTTAEFKSQNNIEKLDITDNQDDINQ